MNYYPWSQTSLEQEQAGFPPEVLAARSPNRQLNHSSPYPAHHPIPSSFSFNSNGQVPSWFSSGHGPLVAQPVAQNIGTSTPRQIDRDPHDRLAVPPMATGTRSRSNSRSSKRASRRNTPTPSDQKTEEQETGANKVRLVGIDDPKQAGTIVAQAAIIEQLQKQLKVNDGHWKSFQAQLNALSEKAKESEQRLSEAVKKAAEAERKAVEAEKKLVEARKNAAEAERNTVAAKKRIDEVETALEAEKVWADERVKSTERNVQQEMEKKLREAKELAVERQKEGATGLHQLPFSSRLAWQNDSGHSFNLRGDMTTVTSKTENMVILSVASDLDMEGNNIPVQMQVESDFEKSSESESEKRTASRKVSQVNKGKFRQVEQPPLGQSSKTQPQIPKPMEFTRPRAGGKRLRLAPPPPPRLNIDYSDNDIDAGPSETFRDSRSFADLGLHEKLEAVLDSNKKMAEMFEAYAKGSPQYRPRQRADPQFKMPTVRSPRNPQRNATLKFIRIHLHELLDITRTEDMLKHKDHIYALNTPLKRAMAAYEEKGTGVGPRLEPVMDINWDKFDGKWNSELCSKFIDYLVDAKGYGDGQPTDEEHQMAVNIFWERLTRLREVVEQNRPKENETEEETNTRIAKRRLTELAKASMNSRRKNTFHDRTDTCLLHIQSQGIGDDEKQAWKNHFAVIQELGVEGMSSDEPDEEDSNVFHVRTLPWRAKELTKICVQTDQARNTTNAFGNRRAGNAPRIRKRRKDSRTSARKAPAGKPVNFYNPEWYKKLGYDQRRKLATKAAVEILDAEFDS